jgi:hypothetical protein
MKQKIEITIEQIKPDPTGVFELQGIPAGIQPPGRVRAVYDEAAALFHSLAAPVGIMADVTQSEFAGIYAGNGLNEPDTPLEHIYPRAERLALFAFTLGQPISGEIKKLLEAKNLIMAYMLDSIASYSADKASEAAQRLFTHQFFTGPRAASTRVLLYSPGYCGWHISGQEKLFAYLEPGEIGITLNESCLMEPLKSISGVLVAGKAEIHRFANAYPFCKQCQTHTCRKRIKFA